MDHHLLFERMAQQMQIAICLIETAVYTDLIDAAEMVGISLSDSEPVGVVAKIAVDDIEATPCRQYLVVETFLKHHFDICPFIDEHFEGADHVADNIVERSLD